MHDSRGSLWRKWDLHIHTPESFEHEYSGPTSSVWDRFLADLERLPQEIKVIGINDYLILDGYRRVREAKANGRLKNIDLVLPVIELRIDKFGGSGDTLRRANFHVIFSDELDPDDIQDHFLNKLEAKYHLTPEHEAAPVSWQGAARRRDLEDLGHKVWNSTPAAKRPTSYSALHIGFSNANFSLDLVMELLEWQAFEGRYFTAVGKTEWESIRWEGQSGAEKRNLINRAHFVFACSASPAACIKTREALRQARVNHRLLDCSDAHRFSTDTNSERRMGKCWTWIKGDTEFGTLRHVYHEPDERIYLGEIPEVLSRVAANPTRYIRSLRIEKDDESDLDEPWFDGTELQFNSGLVAIIGNKGSGKSALLDVLGLLGDTERIADASFLNRRRFAQPTDNKAHEFLGHLEWANGTKASRRLDEGGDAGLIPKVKYVPQNLFERICSDLDSIRQGVFDRELKSVIFSHVPEAKRLEQETLDALIEYQTSEIEDAIGLLRSELHDVNAELVHLAEQRSPRNRTSLQSRLAQKREELDAHRAAKPVEPPKPDAAAAGVAELADRLARRKEELARTQEEAGRLRQRQGVLTRELAALEKARQRLWNVNQFVDRELGELRKDLAGIGVDADALLNLKIDDASLAAAVKTRQSAHREVEQRMTAGTPGSVVDEATAMEAEIRQLQERLDEPHRIYERYCSALEEWEVAEQRLVGDTETAESVNFLEAAVRALDDSLPKRVAALEGERESIATQIVQKKHELAQVLRELYGPVQSFIGEHQLAKRFDLRFSVSLADRGFAELFFRCINHAKAGSFCGVEPARERMNGILARYDLNSLAGPFEFAQEILEDLLADRRTTEERPMRIADQLTRSTSELEVLDLLFGFEYLEPRYSLRLGMRALNQLSPGERGALLLVFYLLVDRDSSPLLIDQPEENLDNQTIYSLLVPSILEAKRRRQIFMVTHNPNLAIVCDAEQIVVAQRDPAAVRVGYLAGAIECLETNRYAVDILEGTRPALDSRNAKYVV